MSQWISKLVVSSEFLYVTMFFTENGYLTNDYLDCFIWKYLCQWKCSYITYFINPYYSYESLNTFVTVFRIEMIFAHVASSELIALFIQNYFITRHISF